MAKMVGGRAAVRTGVRGLLLAGTALAAIATAGQAAGQDFTGEQVTYTFRYPDLINPGGQLTSTVGDGVEFDHPFTRSYQVDVVGDQIVVTQLQDASWNSAAFNGFSLDFAGGPTLLALSLDAGLSTGGATPSFDADTAFINWAGQHHDAGDRLVFNMTLACATSGGDDACQISRATDQSLGIDAQGGNDTLRLSGDSGDFTFDAGKLGSTYTNFEELRKTGAGTVTLTGAFGQTVYADEGTLQIAGSVTATGGYGVYVDGADTTVEVLAGGALHGDAWGGVEFAANGGTLANAGDILGGVFFTGTGTVTNAAGALIEDEWGGVRINGYGDVTNAGTIHNIGRSTFGTYAVVLGGGTVTNQAGGSIVAGTEGDAVYISGDGGVTNAGTIEGASDGVFISGAGTVDNQTGGTIQGGSHGVSIGGATTVTNAGTISATWGEAIYANGLADITNSGGVSSAHSTGVHMQSGGQLTNSGAITGAGYGVNLAAAGTVDNLAGGTIGATNYGVYGAGVTTVDNAGTISSTSNNAIWIAGPSASITNRGTIHNDNAAQNTIYVNQGGSLTTTAGSSIEGGYDGVYFGQSATVDNAGSISGARAGLFLDAGGRLDNRQDGLISSANAVIAHGALTVNNAGEITSSAGNALYVEGAATIVNTGALTSTDNGYTSVFVLDGGSLENQAGGEVAGGYDGVYFGLVASVDNSGTITGATQRGVALGAGGAVTNRTGGQIEGRNYGVYTGGGTLTVANAAGGTISGGWGVNALSGVLDLSSAGTITGTSGMAIVGGGLDDRVILAAGSSTSGNVLTGAGADELRLAGAVTGQVVAGAGNDTVYLTTGGSVSGLIDGGADTDTLILNGTSSATLDLSQLAGFEVQQKQGTGTWTLSGLANTGLGWDVQQGTLASAQPSIDAGATVNVAAGATFRLLSDATLNTVTGAGELALDGYDLSVGLDDADHAFAGDITGGGRMDKWGAGELALSGAADLDALVIMGGSVRLAGDDVLGDDALVLVTAGTELVADGDDAISLLDLQGTLSGAGTLDAGEVHLSDAVVNANLGSGRVFTWDGVSVLNGTIASDEINVVWGDLRLGADERLADAAAVYVSDGRTFDLDGHDETIGGLSGDGVVDLGAGGTLSVVGDGSAFTGQITGDGSVTKAGTGRSSLGGVHDFTGPLSVDGGELAFLAQITSDLNVRGGKLIGGGDIGGALRISGGTVAPGFGGGLGGEVGGFFASSLAVTGGTLSFSFAGADQAYANDLIAVTGAVTLSGGVLDARPISAIGQYGFNQSYLLIDGSSLSGQFDNLTDFTQNAYLPQLYQRLRYDAVSGQVVLEVRRMVDWAEDAETDNQRAVAGGIGSLQMGGGDDWAEVLNLLLDGTPDERRAAYDAMSGEGLANVPTAVVAFSQRFQDVLQGRMAGGATGGGAGGGTAFAALPFGQGARTDVLGGVLNAAETGAAGASGAWAEAFVLDSRLDGQAGVADTTTGGGGFAAGFDVDAGDGWRFGFASGYSDMRSDTDAAATSADGQFWHVGAYAAWNTGPWWAGAAVSRLTGDVDTDRKIGLGPVTLAAAGRTDVDTTDVTAALGRRFALNETTALDASASVNGTRLKQDAYTETGAGALSLDVAGVSRTVWVGELDARVTRSMAGGKLKPYAGAGAAFASGDLDSLASVAFAGAPAGAGAFVVEGAELPSAWATLEAGVAFKPSERVWVSLAYDGALAERLQEHRGSVKVSLKW